MQYGDYYIQTTESGCIVRDSLGRYLVQVPTEREAQEWIDERRA